MEITWILAIIQSLKVKLIKRVLENTPLSGVAFVFSKNLHNPLTDTKLINDNVIFLKFQTKCLTLLRYCQTYK